MVEYNYKWITEWDKPKIINKIIIGIIEIPLFIIENWKGLLVAVISMISWMYYLNSLNVRTDIFSGNVFYLLIGIVLPLVFGLGVRQGHRYGYC